MKLFFPLTLLLVACEGTIGPEGPAGADGADGAAGADGLNGADGAAGANGENGADGADGADGTNGVDGANGADGNDGANGADGADGVDGADGADGANGADGRDGVDGVDGEDGHDAGWIELEAAGVVGFVTDRSGEYVTGGTVYFVPTGDVAALGATTVAVGSTTDEPLEDVIAASGSTYEQATVDVDGSYRLATLSAGTYFITWVPAADDDGHLPGGTYCRVATDAADLLGTQLDLEVSSAAPADAEFVGSGVCVACHGKTHIDDTLHRVGIWSPYESGALQDLAGRDELYDALEGKFDAETTVYFYGYDSTRGMDKYKTAETDPGTGVAFSVTVSNNGGMYEMLLHNNQNTADPDVTLPVDLVYGGGTGKQRYMTRVESGSTFYNAVLPLQYQTDGDEGSTYPRTSKVWRDYYGSYWYNETTDTFTTPAASKSFEKNCMSCHAVGSQITGSDTAGWTAAVVTDRVWGDFDYTGDGYPDEMNVGCENCHGPGSAHWDASGLGKDIVSPSLLTPERETVVCGQCHSRPKGALGTDSPVNSDGWMMRAGTSRDDFLSGYATTQLDGASTDYYADTDLHSKSHHQQYSDFIRTGMYKNGTTLMTCSSCHDPHQRQNEFQLREDPADEAALCGGACHDTVTADMETHIDTEMGAGMGLMMSSATCVDCHMPKTAKTGAGEPGLTIGSTLYWENDVSSHLFAVPDKAWSATTSQSMPTPYTTSCASSACHASL